MNAKTIGAYALGAAALGLAGCSSEPKFYSTFFLPKNQSQSVALGKSLDCTVYFDLDSARIRADQMANIDRCAHYLSSHPDEVLALGGHADERGTESYNDQLARRRADAVKQALYQRGIAADHISVASFGAEASADTEAAWSHSRRVDVVPQKPQAKKG